MWVRLWQTGGDNWRTRHAKGRAERLGMTLNEGGLWGHKEKSENAKRDDESFANFSLSTSARVHLFTFFLDIKKIRSLELTSFLLFLFSKGVS